jgi:hypothetical protein
MTTKKIIKYTLIALPLMLLTNCIGQEIIRSIPPTINPSPTAQLKIYGKFPFEKSCTLTLNIKYAPNDSFGMRQTQWIKVPTDIKKDGSYEAIVYKDYYKQIFSNWKMVAFSPEIKCKDYTIQGGVAMVNLTDKSTVKKKLINCTREQNTVKRPSDLNEHIEKRITCAVGNTHSIGFEEVSNLSKEIEIDFADKGFDVPYYELIK